MTEHERIVHCFGGDVLLRASGRSRGLDAQAALVICERLLREMHDRLTCFEPRSELSRLNDDPRTEVPVSPVVARLAAAVRPAGLLSGGLVDATVVPGRHGGDWRDVGVGRGGGTVVRPPGTRIDSGGLAKGMAADLLADRLAGCDSYLVECMGDLRTGGRAGLPRPVRVAGPCHRRRGDRRVRAAPRRSRHERHDPPHRPAPRSAHRASPRDRRPPGDGARADALEAEVRAKAALLHGPREAPRHLPFGGTIVLDDGTILHLPAGDAMTLPALAA